MKKVDIIKIIYLLSSINFFIYAATKKSAFLFNGGLLLIVASVMLIVHKIKK